MNIFPWQYDEDDWQRRLRALKAYEIEKSGLNQDDALSRELIELMVDFQMKPVHDMEKFGPLFAVMIPLSFVLLFVFIIIGAVIGTLQ